MIRINLAPLEARRRRSSFGFSLPTFNLGIAFGVVYVLVAVAVAVTWWGFSAREARIAEKVAADERELASLKATLGAGANVKTQLADIKKRVALIESLQKEQGRPIALIDTFADTLPPDLWVTGLEEKASVLKIRGTAFTTTAAADFMSNLRATGKFKEIDIVIARQELVKAPSLVTFEVTCRFEI